MLYKDVYLYKHMDESEKSEILKYHGKYYCLKKKQLYSNLNMEDITDADYMHAKKVLQRI